LLTTVYVINDVPDDNPEISPEIGFIDATLGVPLVHVPPLTVELKVVDPGKQITSIPLKVPALTEGQLTAEQVAVPDVKQVPTPPIGVTMIDTASFGFNPFTTYGEVTPFTIVAEPPFIE
jgi:hypothetical protein